MIYHCQKRIAGYSDASRLGVGSTEGSLRKTHRLARDKLGSPADVWLERINATVLCFAGDPFEDHSKPAEHKSALYLPSVPFAQRPIPTFSTQPGPVQPVVDQG